MPHKVFRPHTMKGRVIVANEAKAIGGSILLGNVGSGNASSWNTMESYMKDVGSHRVKSSVVGSGLGGELERKLSKLSVAGKKKPKNITLDM